MATELSCITNCPPVVDGKYVVLPSGELQIRNVSAEDGFKTYKCRTKHRLTGETKLSATAGRLVITGKQAHCSRQNGPWIPTSIKKLSYIFKQHKG